MPFRRCFTYIIAALDIGKQSRAGALGLLIYDYLITFGLEVDVVWRQTKRSPLSWLYLFNRFFPVVWLVIAMVPFTPTGVVSSKACIIYLATDDSVILVSTLSVQVILQLRVYALYQKSKRVQLFLICGFLVEIVVMVIFIGITFANIKELPVISTPTGCYYTGIFSISALFWLPALVYEPILCLMVVWKAREDRWWGLFRRQQQQQRTTALGKDSASGKLIRVFARDSLMYFVGIFIELVINTAIWSHYNRYINIVVPWSGALPSVLGSRLFLRMREAILFPERYDSDVIAATWGTEGDRSTVRFAKASQRQTSPFPFGRTAAADIGRYEAQSSV